MPPTIQCCSPSQSNAAHRHHPMLVVVVRTWPRSHVHRHCHAHPSCLVHPILGVWCIPYLVSGASHPWCAGAQGTLHIGSSSCCCCCRRTHAPSASSSTSRCGCVGTG